MAVGAIALGSVGYISVSNDHQMPLFSFVPHWYYCGLCYNNELDLSDQGKDRSKLHPPKEPVARRYYLRLETISAKCLNFLVYQGYFAPLSQCHW